MLRGVMLFYGWHRLTCGGLQSAHTLAVSAIAAELGIACHLLVRGEKPAVPVGNHLLAKIFSRSLQYVSRNVYANREAMFNHYAEELHKQLPSGSQVPSSSLSMQHFQETQSFLFFYRHSGLWGPQRVFNLWAL
jgi:1-aminocyclopropane-1-carboxylate deaminase/D-cysteine desulfhydrase-like pyridoxal-dependent ACC family enzyme